MLTVDPHWAAGYTTTARVPTRENPYATEDFTGAVHRVSLTPRNPKIIRGGLHTAETALINAGKSLGHTGRGGLPGLAKFVHEKTGHDAYLAQDRDGNITGALTLVDTEPDEHLDPETVLRNTPSHLVAGNLQKILDRLDRERPEAKAELADPDPTPAFDRYAAHRKHLATLPVVHSQPLGNPVDHSNVSHVLTLQHPRRQIKAVFKPSEGEQPGLRMHIPMHAGAQAARESAASHVAEIAGYHDLVPATTLRHHEGQHGSVQRFIKDGISAFKFDEDERYGSSHGDVRRAAAFDYLIGNTDRHQGNWLVRPTPHGDKITLIDHGLAFPEKHPDGRESYNYELIRHAMYHKPTRGEPAPNPGGHDPDGKWLAIRRALTDHGIGHKAIADTGKRWRVLTSGRFHFGDLLSEHPDYLIQKLNAAPTPAPTRSGV